MTVLILSTCADVHAAAVMEALAARSDTHAELLDLSEFPSQLALTMEFEGTARGTRLRRKGGGEIDLASVRSVWWRRPQPFGLPREVRDGSHRRFAMSEATTAFYGMYQSLDAFWVNEPARDAVASHKPYQLAVAQAIGLEIPPTMMTNDPDAAQAFWRKYPGEVVFKQFIALPDTWRETRRLGEAEQAVAETLSLAPVIFQQHVPAVADLRVIIVGDTLFAAATDVCGAAYPQDVRMNLDARYAPHDLPREVADRLLALMRRLGLVYGAIDLRLTPDGRYVFLEINPAGQFLYIERATGQEIAATLARQLVEGWCLDAASACADPPSIARHGRDGTGSAHHSH